MKKKPIDLSKYGLHNSRGGFYYCEWDVGEEVHILPSEARDPKALAKIIWSMGNASGRRYGNSEKAEQIKRALNITT